MQQSKYFILYSSTNKFILLEKVKIYEKKTTLDINFRTDNNQLQTKENRNERENN